MGLFDWMRREQPSALTDVLLPPDGVEEFRKRHAEFLNTWLDALAHDKPRIELPAALVDDFVNAIGKDADSLPPSVGGIARAIANSQAAQAFNARQLAELIQRHEHIEITFDADAGYRVYVADNDHMQDGSPTLGQAISIALAQTPPPAPPTPMAVVTCPHCAWHGEVRKRQQGDLWVCPQCSAVETLARGGAV